MAASVKRHVAGGNYRHTWPRWQMATRKPRNKCLDRNVGSKPSSSMPKSAIGIRWIVWKAGANIDRVCVRGRAGDSEFEQLKKWTTYIFFAVLIITNRIVYGSSLHTGLEVLGFSAFSADFPSFSGGSIESDGARGVFNMWLFSFYVDS